MPNLFDSKYKRIFGYRRLTDAKATRGEIGIPRVLSIVRELPAVVHDPHPAGLQGAVLSGRSSRAVLRGMESIRPRMSATRRSSPTGTSGGCWTTASGPSSTTYVNYEQKRRGPPTTTSTAPSSPSTRRCSKNLDKLREVGIKLYRSVRQSGQSAQVGRAPDGDLRGLRRHPRRGARRGRRGLCRGPGGPQRHRGGGRQALAYMVEHGCKGIVLAGRHYHVDPEINRGIPRDDHPTRDGRVEQGRRRDSPAVGAPAARP